MKQASLEALKEFFRTGILGSLVTAILTATQGINVEAGSFEINWNILVAAFAFSVLTALARAIDRFIHEWDGTKLNGLMPF